MERDRERDRATDRRVSINILPNVTVYTKVTSEFNLFSFLNSCNKINYMH